MNENETDNVWRCNQSAHSFRIDLWLSAADRTHEQDARVAGETADIQTGQLLILKRCLYPITFCNYKYININHFQNSAVFYTYIHYQSQSIHTQPTTTVALHHRV